jgi:hypothetical protein
VHPGLRRSNERLHALGVGQHGLAWQDKRGGCYSVYAAGPTEA